MRWSENGFLSQLQKKISLFHLDSSSDFLRLVTKKVKDKIWGLC